VPVAGTISVVDSFGRGCNVSVSRAGLFEVSLPGGRYTITGHSPSFGQGRYLCSASRSVGIGPAKVANQPVVVNVICAVRRLPLASAIAASENGFVVVLGLGCSLVGFAIGGRRGLF
jgi:hypothetical protein